jgi:hypothetical protein
MLVAMSHYEGSTKGQGELFAVLLQDSLIANFWLKLSIDVKSLPFLENN